MSNTYEPMERDEFDLWAESNEETLRKQCEHDLNRLTMLGNLDAWISEAFEYIDNEVRTIEVLDDE